jgi:hypothetical protein
MRVYYRLDSVLGGLFGNQDRFNRGSDHFLKHVLRIGMEARVMRVHCQLPIRLLLSVALLLLRLRLFFFRVIADDSFEGAK